jgi:hypothetical protein
MNFSEYKNFLVIPEEIVKHCAQQVAEEYPSSGNNFKLCLDYGDKFRIAGLTPVYLCKDNMRDVFVTSMEKFQNKFH